MEVLRNPEGDVVTGALTQLTFDEGDKDQPVWSPDGSQIAYVAPGGGNNGLDIWVMGADGATPRTSRSTPGTKWTLFGCRMAPGLPSPTIFGMPVVHRFMP